jgi:hypothetical protein
MVVKDARSDRLARTPVAWALIGMLAAAVGCGNSGHNPEYKPMQDAAPQNRDAGMSSEDGGTQDGSVSQTRSSFSLSVRTLQGEPIEGAAIQLGEQTQSTSERGLATFEGLEAGRLVAQIDATGYATGSAVATLPESTEVHRTVHLLEAGDPLPFDAENGDEVYKDRVHLTIPENALVDSEGNPVTNDPQKPKAVITPLNPSTDQLDAMPGPLMGVLEGDTEATPMQSVFMADIKFRQGGERLQVAEGKSVRLEYVLPDDLQEQYSIGDEIEAYWYDRQAGQWMQEGKGEVGESTYASDRLAWFVDVSHFTWWNCDEPWTDKNCLNVNVIRADDGSPVGGASVYAEGVTYNGTSHATTGSAGYACLDFKKGAEARITVETPGNYSQAGSARTVMGSSQAAACSGQGGSCQNITIDVVPPTCLSGTIQDSSGSPAQGVDVYGYYEGASGQKTAQATTDSSGSYCLEVPQGRDVKVFASTQQGGSTYTASATVSASSSSASCGGGQCTQAPQLSLQQNQQGCLKGQLASELNQNFAGTPVRVYARGSGSGMQDDGVEVDCSKSPSEWGSLLGETTAGAGGHFCAPVPVTDNALTIVAGRCGSNDERCARSRRVYEQKVTTAASCGSGACTELVEQIWMGSTCGIGP